MNTPQEDVQPDSNTVRGLERHSEDSDYVPVIIKRNDEAVRHPDDVLTFAIKTGLEQLHRPTVSLWLSALAGGLFVGFTAMAVAVMAALDLQYGLPIPQRLATALVYPFGFIVCLMSGTELFTEHTATAVYPVLDRQARVYQMVRLWLIVLAGNLLGAFVSAFLLVRADSVIGASAGYAVIGEHLVHAAPGALLISAMLAGWLMALSGWLILAMSNPTSQILAVYIVTFLIGLGGLHHSIAGSVEMFAALFSSDQFSWGSGLQFIALAVLGNLVGGSIFVAVLNYGHIRTPSKD